MIRRFTLVALLLALAIPMAASQFVEQPFDEVARGAQFIVRANVIDTWSQWDDAHQVIFTYATLRVTRYFGETTGPDTLVIREVGGTVDGYTMDAVGFPVLRRNEQIVAFLATDGEELRIHGYNQGKFLVQERRGREVLVADPVKQGDAPRDIVARPRFDMSTEAETPGLGLDEFARMVEDARGGNGRSPLFRNQQN